MASSPLLEAIVQPSAGKDLLARSVLLGAATAVDAYVTYQGLQEKVSEEMNPLVNFWMEHFGTVQGLIFFKALPAFGAILASGAAYKYGKSKFSQHLRNLPLNLGIITYTAAAYSWFNPELVQKVMYYTDKLLELF